MNPPLFSPKKLACLLSLLFLSGTASAQDLWDMSLEELVNVKVVSATRKESNSLQLPFAVTVISGEELSRWGAENLADGLRTVAGMQVRKSPADFPQYAVTIRGNSADFLNIRTLFMIDGIPVRNPNAGFDPGWIPLSIIKRVEIVKGPASNLYGANAFGGVVNVITKTGADLGSADKWDFDGSLGYRTDHDVAGNKNVGGASGTLSAGKNGTGWNSFLSGQYFGHDDTKPSYAGHQNQDAFGKIKNNLSDNVVLTSSALLSFDRNQVALANTNSPMQNDFAHVTTGADIKINEDSSLNISGFYSNFKHFLKYTDSLDKYENLGQAYGASSQYSTHFGQDHSVIVGAEYTQDRGSLETMENDYSTFPPALKPVGWAAQTQSTYGIYSQYEFSGWSQFLPSIGVRFDSNSIYGSAVSPRLGLSYLYDQYTTLYTSAGRGFRSPVFNETRISGFGRVGNPNLNPEYITTYEVGIKSVQLVAQNSLSIFREDVTQKIDLEAVPSTTLFTYKNFGTDSITGVELDGSYKLAPSFRIYYNTTLLKTDKSSGGRIARIAEQVYNLGANWVMAKWDIDAIVSHSSEAYYYNTNATIPSDSESRIFRPSITTANLQVKHEIVPKTTLIFFVDNIMDRTYEESFSPFIIQDSSTLPGRNFGLKVNSRF